MSPTWLKAAALLLGVAVPLSAYAESEAPGHKQRWRPKNSIVNIFSGGNGSRPLFREIEVRDFNPDPSVSGEADPAPSARLIRIPTTTGNLVYVPEKLEPLVDRKLKAERPADTLAAAIFDELQAESPVASVLPAERKAILAHYTASDFRPLWTTPAGLTGRARDVLERLRDSAAHGLDPADYELHVLGGFELPAGGFAGDLEHLARLDIELTARAMAYARHASGGRLVPNRLSTYNDIEAPRVDPARAMKMLATSPFAAQWLEQLHPAHPAYQRFKRELAELRSRYDGDAEMPLPVGKRIRPGQSDERLSAVRRRLVRLGLLEDAVPDLTGLPPAVQAGARAALAARRNVLDSELSDALKALQKKHNLKPTGWPDQLTVRLLNDQGPGRSIARLIANMERLRWLPRDLGARHLFVNQAAFRLAMVDNGHEIWRTNVVVGKTDTQTAAFHDEMETVVFNPSWGVPPSILTNEMLPILWRDPSYLDRKGFTVVDRSGKKVLSNSVNWAAYGANAPFSIMQPPGEDNALGEVKFLFPNKHHIYMHDTPSRQLFSRPVRTFSHGCVRVENPRRLAELLLGYTSDEVARKIGSGRSQSVRIKDKIPVHLTYFTAWPDESGRIEYFPDSYGRDSAIDSALTKKQVALR